MRCAALGLLVASAAACAAASDDRDADSGGDGLEQQSGAADSGDAADDAFDSASGGSRDDLDEHASSDYDRRWSSSVEAQDGLQWQAILEAAPLDDTVDGVVAGCEVDAERDAVIPVRVGFERYDDGFSGDVSAEFSLQSFDGTRGTWLDLGAQTAHLEIGFDLPSGARCESYLSEGPRILVQWRNVPSGASSVGEDAVPGAIVVKDYRTPSRPDGLTDLADRLWAQPSATAAAGAVLATEGPDVMEVDSLGGNAYELFPLLDGGAYAGSSEQEPPTPDGQDGGEWTRADVRRFLEVYTDIERPADIYVQDDLPARTCDTTDGFPAGRRLSGGDEQWVSVALFADASAASAELARRLELLEDCEGYEAADGICQPPEILESRERLIYRTSCPADDGEPADPPTWVLSQSGRALIWTLDVIPEWQQIVEAFESGPDDGGL